MLKVPGRLPLRVGFFPFIANRDHCQVGGERLHSDSHRSSSVCGKWTRLFYSPGPAGVCVPAGLQEVRRGQTEPAQPGQLYSPDPGHLSVWERVVDGACVLLRPGQK